MKYILIIAAFNAVFYSVLLLQKKPRAFHDNVLFFWLLYLSLLVGSYAFSSTFLFNDYPLLGSSFISLLLLHGPFLYLYISTLVAHKQGFKNIDFIHFVPFFIFNCYLLVVSFFPDISEQIRLDHVSSHVHPPLLFVFFLIITALSGPTYFLLSIRLFRQLDINIFNNFSSSENIDLDWLRKLVYIFGTIWTALIVIATIHHVFQLFSMSFCTDGLTLSLSVFIILVGYYGLKQKEIFIDTHNNIQSSIPESNQKYAGSSLKDRDVKLHIEKLNQYMVAEKPYLNPDLTLSQLANELEIPSHHLSQIINEHFNINFFDFINRFRVEDVKTKMFDPKYSHYSLLGIAFESGFNSKSAFNRIFKKFTGKTPSLYKSISAQE
ncbi:MAG: AraC family transcriptional regulator [Bacteroidetes bacterium HGW-Bacteroidetes-15]|nr:MAG: AraC family transcriptional regulator [Bacteroidetes bacterium HGW-Bacteroidetes-15]